ncbi:class F sortase [Streptomyces sp. NPDC093094]|uniref:class F sortase n=1 Tax=Streptomyces sp. NPDC093094 TaxID=3366026 RepID=UPI003815DF45
MAARPVSHADGDSAEAKPGSRAGLLVMSAVGLTVLAMTLIGGNDGPTGSAGPPSLPLPPVAVSVAPPAPVVPSSPQAVPSAPALKPTGRHLPRSRPVRLRIPRISVDAPFTDLAIGPTGQLQPPPAADTNLVGWHAKGASPGETGTSIIAGHVDTKTSAAVFVNLGQLRKGNVFYVDRADGRRATFVVDSVETFDKARFPDERVYADTGRAQVRLITCAGDYDRKAKDYTDNLVVFAHLR